MIKTLLACMAALVSHFSLANDTVLLGCWQTTYQLEFFADGRTTKSANLCEMDFDDERFTTRCKSSAGGSVYVYGYQITRPGVFEATVESSSAYPKLVGSVRKAAYRIEGGLLYIAVVPTVNPARPAPAPIKVESVSSKMVCKTSV